MGATATTSGLVKVEIIGDSRKLMNEIKKVDKEISKIGSSGSSGAADFGKFSKLNNSMKSASNVMKQLQGITAVSSKSLSGLASGAGLAASRFTGLAGGAGAVAGRFAMLGSAAGPAAIGILAVVAAYIAALAAVKGFISGMEPIAEKTKIFERLDASLTAVVGSTEEVTRVQGMLKNMANELAQRYTTLTDQYVKFRASTGDVANVDLIFKAIISAADKTKKSVADTQAVLDLFAKWMAKGEISAKELVTVLNEKLPKAVDILADMMKMNREELVKTAEEIGGISSVYIPALSRQLLQLPTSAKSLTPLTDAFTRLGNAWDFFLKRLGEGGAIEKYIGIFKRFTDALENENIIEMVSSLLKMAGAIADAAAAIVIFPIEALAAIWKFFSTPVKWAWNIVLDGISSIKNALIGLLGWLQSLPIRLYNFLLGLFGMGGETSKPTEEFVLKFQTDKAVENMQKAADEARELEEAIKSYQEQLDKMSRESGTTGMFGQRKTIDFNEWNLIKFQKEAAEEKLKELKSQKKLEIGPQLGGTPYTPGATGVTTAPTLPPPVTTGKELKELNDLLAKKQRELEISRLLTSDMRERAKLNDIIVKQEKAIAALEAETDPNKKMKPQEIAILKLEQEARISKYMELGRKISEDEIAETKRKDDMLLGIHAGYLQSLGDMNNGRIEQEKERGRKELANLTAEKEKGKISEQEFNKAKEEIAKTTANNIATINKDINLKRLEEEKRVTDMLRSINSDYLQSLGDEATGKIVKEKEEGNKRIEDLKIEVEKKLMTQQSYLNAVEAISLTTSNNIRKIETDAGEQRIRDLQKYDDFIKKLGEEKKRDVESKIELDQKLIDIKTKVDSAMKSPYEQKQLEADRAAEEYRLEYLKKLPGHFDEAKKASEAYRLEHRKLAEQETLQAAGAFFTDQLSIMEQAVTGVLSYKDAFQQMVSSILTDLAKLALKKALLDSLRMASTPPTGQPGGWNTIATGLSSIFGFAKGGVIPGGFRAFASGGVTGGATLGLIGEGNRNEAVVPLPDGKSIPVNMKGGGNQMVNINVNVDGKQISNPEDAKRMGNMVGKQIEESVRRVLFKEKRVGGLLYSPSY